MQVSHIGIVALATAASEMIAPNAPWVERLGTVGLLVLAMGVAVRYLVNELAKKDAQLQSDRVEAAKQVQAISDAATRAAQDNTRVLVEELRANHDVKERMTNALHELTATLRERNRDR